MSEAVIVDAVRTPSGRRNGALSAIHPVDLLATVLSSAIDRSGVESAMVDDVIAGCVSQSGEQAFNVARKALLAAGFPHRVPGTTIDRQCGSSQQAVAFAAQGILAGAYDCVIACGVESMSRVPLLETAQGMSAEKVAQRWSLSRNDLDRYSLESHHRAAAATERGGFTTQLLPVNGLARDEGIRTDTSLERLASLKPAFTPDGVITAGNSSQVSDGAAAVLVTSAEFARKHGLRARARVIDSIVLGDDPDLMLTAPIPATSKILERTGLTLESLDLIEINEAFASVVLAWRCETGADPGKTNVNGGAIALGHPLGATGARLMTILLNELEVRGGRYGMQVMCEGGGMANATIIERIS